jgi:hypothetical protein
MRVYAGVAVQFSVPYQVGAHGLCVYIISSIEQRALHRLPLVRSSLSSATSHTWAIGTPRAQPL